MTDIEKRLAEIRKRRSAVPITRLVLLSDGAIETIPPQTRYEPVYGNDMELGRFLVHSAIDIDLLFSLIDDLRDENEKMEAELEACRRDADRLDKVEAQMLAIFPYSGGGWLIETDAPTGGDDFQEIRLYEGRGTLREAIDSALAKETPDDPRD